MHTICYILKLWLVSFKRNETGSSHNFEICIRNLKRKLGPFQLNKATYNLFLEKKKKKKNLNLKIEFHGISQCKEIRSHNDVYSSSSKLLAFSFITFSFACFIRYFTFFRGWGGGEGNC